MDKEIDVGLLGSCIGAAVTFVSASGNFVHKHDKFIFDMVCDKTFELYFEMKQRVDEHNARVSEYWETCATERQEQLAAKEAEEQVLVPADEPVVAVEGEIPHQDSLLHQVEG